MATEYVKQNILPDTKQFQHYDEMYLTFKDNGTAIDITSFIFTMEFRKDNQDGVLVQKLILTAGQLEIVDQSGIKKLKINPFAIPVSGKIYYDLRMKYPVSLKLKYYVGGNVKVTPSVTKQDN